MIIPPNMEHQKLTVRGCLGLIVFTLSILIGLWLVIKFDMCPFRVTGEGDKLENRSTIDSNPDFGNPSYKRFQLLKEVLEFRQDVAYNLHKLSVLITQRSPMHATSKNILEAFNQLPEIEKHTIASEIIKQVALLNIPPLTDEALTEIADALFVEHDKMEAADAKAIMRG